MLRWLGLAALIGLQIAYPLVTGANRAILVVVTVLLGFGLSVGHAVATRGVRVAAALVAVATGGGLAVEAIGVSTGFPFGSYAYGSGLGPRLLAVPLVVPLAWTWMAWPAWLVAGRLALAWERRRTGVPATGVPPVPISVPRCGALTRSARVGIAGLALAGWDFFLDPQMVAQGYWTWSGGNGPVLPGDVAVPLRNYLGWLGVALLMMAAFAAVAGQRAQDAGGDAPMMAVYLWTYYSSVLAHALFLDLPASALWGGVIMGLVAVPVTAVLIAPLWTARFGPAPARR